MRSLISPSPWFCGACTCLHIHWRHVACHGPAPDVVLLACCRGCFSDWKDEQRILRKGVPDCCGGAGTFCAAAVAGLAPKCDSTKMTVQLCATQCYNMVRGPAVDSGLPRPGVCMAGADLG